MLNQTIQLPIIAGLLDDPIKYEYKIETSTGTIADTDSFETDIIVLATEVYLANMLDKMYAARYSEIATQDFVNYSEDELRILYAECYYIAGAFLKKYVLKYETENFQTTYSASDNVYTKELSGKLFAANEYYKKAEAFLKDIKFETSTITKSYSIARW